MFITIVAALIGIAVGTVIAVIHNIASQKQRRRTLGGTLILGFTLWNLLPERQKSQQRG